MRLLFLYGSKTNRPRRWVEDQSTKEMGRRGIDQGDGSKTNRPRRWVEEESTKEMGRRGIDQGDGSYALKASENTNRLTRWVFEKSK